MTSTDEELPMPDPVHVPPMNPAGALWVFAGATGTEVQLHRSWAGATAFCGIATEGSVPVPARDDLPLDLPLCGTCSEVAWTVQIARERAVPPPEVIIFRQLFGPVVVCPHCKAQDCIAENDRAARVNEIEFTYEESVDDVEPGSEQVLALPRDNERTFETVRYQCTNCWYSVSIPPDSVEFAYS